jgi:uncharacterized repeat protein (TIGR03803 family)
MNEFSQLKPGACLRKVVILFTATASAIPAQTFTLLHTFKGSNGTTPAAALVQGTNGDFYGTAGTGGSEGDGTIFKLSSTGELTTLYSFCSQSNCSDGDGLSVPLIQAANGNFYGTTGYGGAGLYGGGGTVFEVTPHGTLTTLYSFCSQPNCADGATPSSLLQATNGNFYGTTVSGGGFNGGTFFEITPAGTFKTVYSFCSQNQEGDCTDGAFPQGLVQATDGEFYGTTFEGGYPAGSADGTVFKLTSTGVRTTLHNFDCTQDECANGYGPETGVIQATNGYLYGSTSSGGATGSGTIFQIGTAGGLTTIYNFCSQAMCADGNGVEAPLIEGTDGNLYGMTCYGGLSGNFGTVFGLTTTGVFTTIYDFCPEGNCADGANPSGGLIQGTNGNFYGTATSGGVERSDCLFGCGTAFSLSLGLEPFVETRPTLGMVGSTVEILGNGLTGATSVSFNGTPAVFKVVGSSLITATVPVSATSGLSRS